MLLLATNANPATAFTDLINALVILLMLFSLRFVPLSTHPQSPPWRRLLQQIALSSFLGFILHIRPWTYGPLIGIWLFLYAVLLEALHTLLTLLLCTFLHENTLSRHVTRFFRIAQMMVFAILALLLLRRRNPIRLFLLYATAVAGVSIFYLIRLSRQGHRGSRLLLLALVPQIPGLVLQFLRRGETTLLGLDFNGLSHLCILVSLVILYFAARNWNTYK